MRVSNMLHFTENHRFFVYRDFALSGLDYRMLSGVYQPMIGPVAGAVFMTLCQQLAGERVGYSSPEQQRKLFLALELEPGDRGRKFFVEQTSKLEAVGLLQTTRRLVPDTEESVFEYRLFQPLAPVEFFKNQHLTLLLRDKIGKYAVLALKDELIAEEPAELVTAGGENLSVPFYDIFRLNTQVIDYELEQAIYQSAAARQNGQRPDTSAKSYDYADIITRVPQSSRNRPFAEQLKYRPDDVTFLNFVAKKYELTLQELGRLLDEDAVFDPEGELIRETVEHRAQLIFRQSKKRGEDRERFLQKARSENAGEGAVPPESAMNEKTVEQEYYLDVPPLFQGQCDVHQYNFMLRNEPYTKVLQKFFPQGTVPDGILDVCTKIDLNYGLADEVINVMIHFIHAERRSWAKSSIEAVASDMLGKSVLSYEQAVEYVRERIRYREQGKAGAAFAKAGASGGGFTAAGGGKARGSSYYGNGAGSKAKPRIPVSEGNSNVAPLTDEEMEHFRSIARKLQSSRMSGEE